MFVFVVCFRFMYLLCLSNENVLVCCSVLVFHVIVLMFHILVTFRSNGSGIIRDEEALLCLCHGRRSFGILVSSRVFCTLV